MTPDEMLRVLLQVSIVWAPLLYLVIRFGVEHAIKGARRDILASAKGETEPEEPKQSVSQQVNEEAVKEVYADMNYTGGP